MIAGFEQWTPEFVVTMLLSIFYTISGALKLFNLSGFGRTLQHYHFFPPIISELISYLLPPLEITLGILLFTKSYLSIVLITTFLLQLSLSLFTIFALHKRGHLKNSGIFGATISIQLSALIVAVNILLLVGAGYLMFLL